MSLKTLKKDAPESGWKIDPAKCVGCGDCIILCPVKALKIERKVAVMADLASCLGESCRMCELNCWKDAIRAYLEGVA